MNKLIKFGTVLILVMALIAVNNSASASGMPSENKEMPLCKDVMNWENSFSVPEGGNFVDSSYDSYIETFPKGHVDKVKDKNGEYIGIVFYYYDPASPKEYGSLYYDSEGNKMSIGCDSEDVLTDSYKGEGSSKNDEKEVTESQDNDSKPVDEINDTEKLEVMPEEDSNEVEEDENDSVDNRTYAALLEFLIDDDTNENSFKSSKSCAIALKDNLVDEGWDSKLVKATFKATGKTGKHLIRYCVGIETSDEGTVYIDSYSGKAGNGIDKRVTVLEAGKKWKAESADGICPHDQEGRYNRGKVLKVKIIEE